LLVSLGIDIEQAISLFLTPDDLIKGRIPNTLDVEALAVDVIAVMRKTPQDRLSALVDAAISHKEKVLLFRAGTADEKSKVATEILDRIMGKPTQTIISQNMNFNANVGDIKQIDNDLRAIQTQLSRLEAEKQKLLSAPK
jgi:hypothetical protein